MGLGEAGEAVRCAGSPRCSNCREAGKNKREEPIHNPHAPFKCAAIRSQG